MKHVIFRLNPNSLLEFLLGFIGPTHLLVAPPELKVGLSVIGIYPHSFSEFLNGIIKFLQGFVGLTQVVVG